MFKAKYFLPLFFVLFFLCSCGHKAAMVSSWVDSSGPDYHACDVLVIGVSKSEVVAKLWEAIFVEQFSAAGVQASANSVVIGHVPEPDRRSVEAAIQKAGAATVLITHVIDSSAETSTRPGFIRYEPGGFSHSLYGYYGRTYRAVYTPPLDVTRTTIRLETNLYDVAAARLIWSAQTEVRNPKLLRTDFGRVVGLLMTDMNKQGLLP
ncbi:MAG TPA: hypothetical protein ENK96_10445 [Desulfobulbaceae bacterium]|nr:hypothetical protein [Desulfobulbaceae bacterium]